jgi:hypothetical protein
MTDELDSVGRAKCTLAQVELLKAEFLRHVERLAVTA